MMPTICPSGDLIVIRRYFGTSECIKNASIGDIVVFVSPVEPYKLLLKRLVGLVDIIYSFCILVY